MQPRWIVSSRWICRVLGLLVGLVLLGLLAVLYQRGANVRMLMEAMMEMRDTEDDDLDAQLLFAQARLKKKNRKAPLAEELLQEAGLMDTILEPKDLPACNTLLANATADFRANGLEALGSRWRAFVQASQNRKLTYCMTQCGKNKCCPEAIGGSKREADTDWYMVIKDDLGDAQDMSGVDDITLVTQGSFDRIWTFSDTAHAWPGPKVAVFALLRAAGAEGEARFQQEMALLREGAQKWSNVKVIAVPVTPTMDYYTERFAKYHASPKPQLPLNTFRNMAVDHARTNLIFTSDLDFVPSETLYSTLHELYLPIFGAMDRAALVIPHWELLECGNGVILPRDFDELYEQAKQGHARPFHVSARRLMPLAFELPTQEDVSCKTKEAIWHHGVRSTNYHRWLRESARGIHGAFKVQSPGGPIKDIYYEPFVVVKRVEPSGVLLPRYSEQYVGRFKNKISFISNLRGRHYDFYTVRREFLAHKPHPSVEESDPAMQQHLLDMRALHLTERTELHEYRFKRGPRPEKLPSPFPQGLHCVTPTHQPAEGQEESPAVAWGS